MRSAIRECLRSIINGKGRSQAVSWLPISRYTRTEGQRGSDTDLTDRDGVVLVETEEGGASRNLGADACWWDQNKL